MKLAARLTALEKTTGAGMVLHMPEDDHDHAEEWARLIATRKQIHVVHYEGLNSEAVAAFNAVEPDLRTPGLVVVINKPERFGGAA